MIPITTDNPRSLRTQILISSSIDKLNFRLDSERGRETFENFLTTHDSDAPSTNQTPTPPDQGRRRGVRGLRRQAARPAQVANTFSRVPPGRGGTTRRVGQTGVAVRLELAMLFPGSRGEAQAVWARPAARAVSKALSRAEAEAGHARARIDSAAWRPTRTSYKVLVIRIIL